MAMFADDVICFKMFKNRKDCENLQSDTDILLFMNGVYFGD